MVFEYRQKEQTYAKNIADNDRYIQNLELQVKEQQRLIDELQQQVNKKEKVEADIQSFNERFEQRKKFFRRINI